MSPDASQPMPKVHRFLDEAGDTTFFGKGRVPNLGQPGVSLSFGLGMVKFAAPTVEVRGQIEALGLAVEQDDLLKNKLSLGQRQVITIAERGKSTRNHVLELAMAKARERFAKKKDPAGISPDVVFNVQTPRTEPLLCVPDYLAWAVQRVFERGDTRHYDFVRERVSVVVDLYDAARYEGSRNYYSPRRPLTSENKLGPPVS
jgi:hypothetical protein